MKNNRFGSEERHQKIQDSLEKRLRGYGYKTYTNINYYDTNKERVLGEVDILAFKVDREGYLRDIRIYEVKSGSDGFSHAQEQLKRARKYFRPTKNHIEPKLVYVTDDRHGALKARRVR